MTSIDNLFFTRMVLAYYYEQKGQYACFLPKISKQCGNSCHVQVSLSKDGVNVMGDKDGKYGLSDVGN